jgi:hypothetical protein
MADETFALSPISARATLPREEDYEAIREAFMETSRGRWFLGEYAKRNRNADTRMVLDAVARIEETLATQALAAQALAAQALAAQALAAQKQPQPAPDNRLAEALAAIRSALNEARAAASSAVDGLALEQNLTAVRKGVRVIREIAWRLREIGADGRICDLIDSQASTIEGACGQISSAAPKDALSAAFDLIDGRIGKFDAQDTAAPTPQATSEAASPPPPPPSIAASDEMPAVAVEKLQAQAATDQAEIATSSPAMPVTTVATSVTAEAVDVAVEVPETTEATEMTTDAAAAQDEAVLDLVALEMAAPDSSEADESSESEADEINPLVAADPGIPAAKPEPAVAPARPAAIQASIQPSLRPALKASHEPAREPSREPSLGSTILATGIVQKPNASASDPLAPIRRMSQAEKIALFS